MEWVLLIGGLSIKTIAADSAFFHSIPMRSKEACIKAADNFRTRNPPINKYISFTCISTVTGEVTTELP